MSDGDAFFHNATTNAAIEALAAGSAVTLVVGSGVAKDRESPDWNALAKALLLQVLQSSKLPLRDYAEAVTDLLSSSMDPLHIASATRCLAAEQGFDEAELHLRMHTAIAHRAEPGGVLAPGIALLALVLKASGRDVCIITTNYDDYLERASGWLAASSLGLYGAGRLVTVVDPSAHVSPTDVPVYHLHGAMTDPNGAAAPPVYCEQDYSTIRGGWQETLLQQRLTAGCTLFIGTSMRDPYFSHCLAATLPPARSGTTFAILPRQGEAWLNRETARDKTLLEAVSATAGARLRHLAVEPLFADYFSQVAQFCFEVVNCARQGPRSYSPGSPHRYGHRLQSWWNAWHPPTEEDLSRAQARTQPLLLATKQEVLARFGFSDDPDQYKIEVWSRSSPTDSRSLELWSSSEARLLSGGAIHRAPIEHFSPYLAVRTFADGRALGPALPDGVVAGRWRTAVSVPVWLDQEPWFHLPVGVIGLLSTGTEGLDRLSRTQMLSVTNELSALAARVLRPSEQRTRAELAARAER